MSGKIPILVSASASRSKIEVGDRGIEKVYAIYECLSSENEDVSSKEKEVKFKELLKSLSGSEQEKKLGSQFVAKFIENFPSVEAEALSALFSLLEEDNLVLRKQIEKDLVTICKKRTHLTTSVAYVLSQILQTGNDGELSLVEESLRGLIFHDAEQTLTGMFEQIRCAEYIVVHRCMKLLHTYSKVFGFDGKTNGILCKEILASIHCFDDKEVFMKAMEMLDATGYLKTPAGSDYIVEVMEKYLKVDQPLPEKNLKDSVARVLICSDYVFPYFHGKSSSLGLFTYYCVHLLPKLSELDEQTQLSVLQMTTELSLYFQKLDKEKGKECLGAVLKFTDTLLCKQPKDSDDLRVPNYLFSFLEICLYLIHRIGSFEPEVFKEIACKQILMGMKPKLEYLLRAVVAYNGRLQKDIKDVVPKGTLALSRLPEQSLTKINCLRVLANVLQMGKHLLQRKISTEGIKISWKDSALLKGSLETIGERSRRSSASRDLLYSINRNSGVTKLYQPPTGKFSSRTGSFSSRLLALESGSIQARRDALYASLHSSRSARFELPYSRPRFRF